jgi:hypothetical protein
VLLALFLIDLAAGLYVFLPLVGRRNAGVKFYRLILITVAVLMACAAGAHALARHRMLASTDVAVIALIVLVYLVLRYPKRLIFRMSSILLGVALVVLGVAAWQSATRSTLTWSIIGALASIALLGSVNLAMLLGHWYLVVRGMAIDPLERLTMATLVAVLLRIVVVGVALVVGWSPAIRAEMLFFLMRAGWGLLGPLLLYPLVWGTVKIRSTMAATGILYVDVVAVIIGEVLAGWLATIVHVPV